MLKKENRADRRTIEKIFKEGRFVNSENLTFKFVLNRDSNTPAISFLAPKSITPSAVKRNSLRRRGYSVLGRHFNKLPTNIAGVFIFGKGSLKYFSGRKSKNYNPRQNLEYEIENILNKIH